MMTLHQLDIELAAQPWGGGAAQLVGDRPHLFVKEGVG
jgi:hypothetical protein